MESQLLSNTEGVGSRKGLIQCAHRMSIEVVQDNMNHVCFRISMVNEILHPLREVDSGASIRNLGIAPAGERFN